MTLFELRRRYDTLVYLISCSLNGKAPKIEYINQNTLSTIYVYAKRHSVGALVASALSKIGLADEAAMTDYNMAIRKVMLLDSERARILSELEKNGIKYMPLKGVILKELYPSIGLRQMADNDILFDEEHREDVKNIMESLGFHTEHYNRGNHDVYIKKPVFNYEMHTSLFGLEHKSEFYEYFKDAFDSALKDEGNSCGYSMTDEYFYLFLKAHEFKHHSAGGTGIRSLADGYVFLKAKGEGLNMEHLSEELEKIGLAEYERDTRTLALKIFDPEVSENNMRAYLGKRCSYSDYLSDDERALMDKYFLAGTYGSLTNIVDQRLNEIDNSGRRRGLAKIKYVLGRLFPPREFYRTFSPVAYKYPILIPFVALKRILAMLFLRPVRSFRHLKIVFSNRRKRRKR